MNPHHPSADEIFEQALQLSGEARVAYLKEATGGDEQLRHKIENLLDADASAGAAFLNKPALASVKTLVITTGVIPVTEKPGDKIGRYKLREQIGEGGCGVVYVAEQEEPVRRRVALKVIKLGMDTRQVVARFEAERQALALMDHPNIAKVLDAGATDTGRPYFVMELVRGIKITDYCDQNNLSTEERLKLFILVCSAIQHAHQKGIIHRDIKPSNILVTLHDGVPVPKVIDFGIAKATSDQRLTDKTIYTAFEQFIGTPAYMSPEQAEMSGLDIDTRSDIYSLGVLLYELLTSQTPFDASTLLKAGLDQMRRIIRQQEPQRPSTRLSTLEDADLTAIANHRRAEPPKLISLIHGDLDWIVMKSLEKDRTRRFETVNALAMDVQRHLGNEPVTARPPSAAYRFQKMLRRNRTAFLISTPVIMAIIMALAVSFYLMQKEKVALKRALLAETAQRRSAQEAEANELMYQTADNVAGLHPIFGEIDQETYSRLPQTESQLRKVVAIRTELFGRKDPGVLDAMKKLSEVLAYRNYPAEVRNDITNILREVVEIEKTIKGNEHPDVVEDIGRLEECLNEASSNWKVVAEPLIGGELYENAKKAISLWSHANTVRSQGQLDEAKSIESEALTVEKELLSQDGDNPSLRWHYGKLAKEFVKRQQPGEVERVFDEIFSLQPPPDREADLLSVRAEFRASLKRYKEAADDFTKAASLSSRNYGDSAFGAILLAELGDVVGYRQCVEKMLSESLERLGPVRLNNVALASILLPVGNTNLANTEVITERSLKDFTDYGGYVFIIGFNSISAPAERFYPGWLIPTVKSLLEYRHGNFTEAQAFAEKAVVYGAQPISYAVLAMAQHQQGMFNDAKTNLTKSLELERTISNQTWDDELTTQILLREARSLIESKPGIPESTK